MGCGNSYTEAAKKNGGDKSSNSIPQSIPVLDPAPYAAPHTTSEQHLPPKDYELPWYAKVLTTKRPTLSSGRPTGRRASRMFGDIRKARNADREVPWYARVLTSNQHIYSMSDIEDLLLSGGDMNVPDKLGRTPVFYAMTAAQVQQLVAYRADCAGGDYSGDSPLTLLAKTGTRDVQIARALIDGRAEVDAPNPDGSPALVCAAENSHWEIVHAIVTAPEVDPDTVDSNGATALIWAAFEGNDASITTLLQYKAQINHPALPGCTALHVAASENNSSTAELLLDNGATISAVDDSLMTPLMRAVEFGSIDAVEMLLRRRCEVNFMSAKGKCALSEAITAQQHEIAEVLCEARADAAVVNDCGFSLLTRAALHGDLKLIDTLLQAKADPLMRSPSGWTALLSAAAGGTLPLVCRLLEFVDLGQPTPSSHCMEPQCFKPDDMALALIWAARGGHNSVVRHLVGHKAALELKDQYGRTALLWAACYGNMKVCETLLRHGASYEVEDLACMSPLAWTVENGKHSDETEARAWFTSAIEGSTRKVVERRHPAGAEIEVDSR